MFMGHGYATQHTTDIRCEAPYDASHHAPLSHHGVEPQGVEAAGCPGGVAAVPEVLELLLGLVEHLDALQVLLLKLLKLQEQQRKSVKREGVSGDTHSHSQEAGSGEEGRN